MLYKSDFSNFDNCSCENRWRFSKGLIEVLKGSVNKDTFKGIHFGIYILKEYILGSTSYLISYIHTHNTPIQFLMISKSFILSVYPKTVVCFVGVL